MLVGRIGQFSQGTAAQRQPGAGPAVRRVPLLERRRVRAGQLEAALEPDARIRRALRPLDQQRGTRRPRRLLRPGALRQHQGLVPRPRHVPAGQRRVLRLHRLRRRRRAAEPLGRSPCRASTSPGTSTAKATTCSAAATGCSTTATWATSSTTTRCAWRPTPIRSAPTSGPAAATATASA